MAAPPVGFAHTRGRVCGSKSHDVTSRAGSDHFHDLFLWVPCCQRSDREVNLMSEEARWEVRSLTADRNSSRKSHQNVERRSYQRIYFQWAERFTSSDNTRQALRPPSIRVRVALDRVKPSGFGGRSPPVETESDAIVLYLHEAVLHLLSIPPRHNRPSLARPARPSREDCCNHFKRCFVVS